jgi:hypothetical protein
MCPMYEYQCNGVLFRFKTCLLQYLMSGAGDQHGDLNGCC